VRQFPDDITVELDFESDAINLSVDPEQFRVVVASLIRNSAEAIEGTGQIVVRLASRTAKAIADDPSKVTRFENGFVQLTVEDTGRGLSDVEREHLFDPFFSGRQAGRGLGFGLSKCWQILRQHEGVINFDDTHGPGLCMITQWPIQESASSVT